jgi:phage terminase large subunit
LAHLQLPSKLSELRNPYRYKVLYGGRGGTKSWGIAGQLLLDGTLQCLRVVCLREVQQSIKRSVHQLLADTIERLGLGYHYEVLETEIRGRNGTTFSFSGLSNLTADSIKSFEGADRAWVEEAQTVTKKSWKILIPTIRKPGSEIWISFNPDLDTDDTYVRFIENTPPDTLLININYEDNPWPTKELDAERDHLKKTDFAEYENVWLGKPRAAAEGAIYTRECANLKVMNLPPDPLLKVHTVWDLGFNDATAIIFVQRNLSEIRIVDYTEENHLSIPEHVVKLKEKGYNYGTDFIPWDGAADRFKLTNPANSPEGMLRKLGRTVQPLENVDVESGIKRARTIFPMCYFDRTNTIRLRECLKRYRRRISTSTDEPAGPLHDEFSHGADAFRYLAMSIDRMTNDAGFKKLKYDTRGYV